MRFKTISVRKTRRWFWLADRLPKKVVYYAAIRLIRNATTGKFQNQVVPELTAMDALKRWEES